MDNVAAFIGQRYAGAAGLAGLSDITAALHHVGDKQAVDAALAARSRAI